MKANKIIIVLTAVLGLTACTKLETTLHDSVVGQNGSGSLGATAGLLSNTYNDLSFLHGQDQLFSLEETSSDEALIPTRGGDWDDNGVWRPLCTPTHVDVTHTQATAVFLNLGKLESDATTVMVSGPSTEVAAEALFLEDPSLSFITWIYMVKFLSGL